MTAKRTEQTDCEMTKGNVEFYVERHFGNEDLVSLYTEYVCKKILDERNMKKESEKFAA